MRKGTGQIFMWGWNADYPDPENFLFLLYGPNGKVEHGGENAANYQNPEFDALFEQMKNMDNGPERQAIIDQMMEILRRDAPWALGLSIPRRFVSAPRLVPQRQTQPDGQQHAEVQAHGPEPCAQPSASEWNQPVLWPLWAAAGVAGLSCFRPSCSLPPARAEKPAR